MKIVLVMIIYLRNLLFESNFAMNKLPKLTCMYCMIKGLCQNTGKLYFLKILLEKYFRKITQIK